MTSPTSSPLPRTTAPAPAPAAGGDAHGALAAEARAAWEAVDLIRRRADAETARNQELVAELVSARLARRELKAALDAARGQRAAPRGADADALEALQRAALAEAALGHLQRALEQRAAEADEDAVVVEEALDRAEAAEAEAQRLRAELEERAAREAALAAEAAEAAQLRRRVAELRAERRVAERGRPAAEVIRLRADLASADRDRTSTLQSLELEAASLFDTVAAEAAEAAQLREQVAALSERCARLEGEKAALSGALAAARGERATLAAELASVRTELAGELEAEQRAVQRTRVELERMRDCMVRLGGKLAAELEPALGGAPATTSLAAWRLAA